MSWIILAVAVCLAGGARAQTSTDVIPAPDDGPITRPAACPAHVRGGLFGFLLGYEHAGHSWTADWQIKETLDPVNFARATYVPEGDPFYVVSRDHEARWYHPSFIANCQITEYWFFGRLEGSDLRVAVEVNLGEVVPCSSGGSGPIAPSYDVLGAGSPESPRADASTESCTGDPPATGGAPIPMQRCTTTQTDYYWYYPDTGQLEYRYSETTTSCEAAS